MKTFCTWLALIFGTLCAAAQTLPDAPALKPATSSLSKWDYIADAAVGVTRTLDYTSTEAFLTAKGPGMRAPGHEVLLPTANRYQLV